MLSVSGYSRPGCCECSRGTLCVCGADTRDLGGKTFSVVYALPACLVDVSLLIVELLLFVDLVLFPFPFPVSVLREPATSVRERRVAESTQLKFRIQEKRKGVKSEE